MRYIDDLFTESNAFAEYGSFVHEIMEGYAKGEFSKESLADRFIAEFDERIEHDFPKNKFCDLRETYYKQGVEFLKTFPGYERIEILAVEDEFTRDMGDWTFKGIIDLVYRTGSGDLVVLDYKSKSSFKSDAEQKKYARQLYLYSLRVFDVYGKYPDRLIFYRFRKKDFTIIPFCEEDLKESVSWARDTVEQIRSASEYSHVYDEFYCNNLCDFRNTCEKGEQRC